MQQRFITSKQKSYSTQNNRFKSHTKTRSSWQEEGWPRWVVLSVLPLWCVLKVHPLMDIHPSRPGSRGWGHWWVSPSWRRLGPNLMTCKWKLRREEEPHSPSLVYLWAHGENVGLTWVGNYIVIGKCNWNIWQCLGQCLVSQIMNVWKVKVNLIINCLK